MPASARGRRKRNKTRIAVATIGKQQIDVSKSRLHMIASQCEAVLRMRGIRFEESSGCIAVTNRAAKYKIRPLTTERLIKLLNHVAEFGSFKCRDERGRPTCWEARACPSKLRGWCWIASEDAISSR